MHQVSWAWWPWDNIILWCPCFLNDKEVISYRHGVTLEVWGKPSFPQEENVTVEQNSRYKIHDLQVSKVKYNGISLNLEQFSELEKERETLRGSTLVWCQCLSEGLYSFPSLGISHKPPRGRRFISTLHVIWGHLQIKGTMPGFRPLNPGNQQPCRYFSKWLWHRNSWGQVPSWGVGQREMR